MKRGARRAPLFASSERSERITPPTAAGRSKQKNGPSGPSFLFGAGYEARTRYLHLGKVALYQMSYTRSDKWYYSRTERKVNP